MNRLKIFLIMLLMNINIVVCCSAEIKVDIDSKRIEFDVAPIIRNDRVLVPMRKIFEELDCEVEWLPDFQTVIATKNNLIVAMQIGKKIILINDMEINKFIVKEFDVAPIIQNSRTLIPVRIISECLGYFVSWNTDSQTVIIKSLK